MRERLSADFGREIVDYLVTPRLTSNLEASYAAILGINRAHVVMLAEERIIDRRAAGALLRCLTEMESAGPACVALDPAKKDLYFNLEAEVIRRIGAGVGGQMHARKHSLHGSVQVVAAAPRMNVDRQPRGAQGNRLHALSGGQRGDDAAPRGCGS